MFVSSRYVLPFDVAKNVETYRLGDVGVQQLGGTVGDIESAPFVEAMRQFQFRVGQDNFALIHVSLVPAINGELKTKPTQASIRDLRGLGLTPDLARLPLFFLII